MSKIKIVGMIRQGDVLLIRRARPADAKKIDARGLKVAGERTGHNHILEAEIIEEPNGRRLVHVPEGGALMRHEEHAAVHVPAGYWEPRLQREFVPESRPRARALYD